VSRLTTLERLDGESWTTRPRVLSIHPAVADTSALIDELMASTRHRQVSPLLQAMEFGLVRLFASHRVWAEVPRIVETLGRRGRLDREAAEYLWWTRYASLVRVVDTAALPVYSTADRLRDRDPSDGPTADLAGLLAPVVVFAVDLDLIDLDVAQADWRPVARAGGSLAATGGTAYGAIVGMTMAGQAIVAVLAGMRRLLGHPYGQLVAVLGGLTLIAARHRVWTASKDRAAATREAMRDLGEPLKAFAQNLYDRLDQAYQAWDASQRGEGGDSLTHATARLLACALSPLTRTELAAHLQPESGGSPRQLVRQLGSVLNNCSAFVEIERGRWQLGRASVDFGVGSEWRGLAGADDPVERYARPPSLALRLVHSTLPSAGSSDELAIEPGVPRRD